MIWPATLALSVLGSAGGMATAAILLFASPAMRTRVVPWLVSYAVGTLLGAALLGLLPQALETLPPAHALGTLLAGIMSFFVLEKLVLWRHSHDDHECDVHKSTVALVIAGDAVHTFVDGVVIAAAALVSLPLGATTALAVATHEIPQEAGDFAILLAAGHSRSRAFLLNLTSAVGGILGAAAMLIFGSSVPGVLPYVLSFAAGNFLYIAMTDLIPTLHRGTLDRNAIRQLILIGLGVGTMVMVQ
ncbi:MAG TPA: ZIP family metal transporter [Vicinamibacterales bacterium]|nr:ZIP family metal transporter [Vicinamibacterales bacterium]